MFVSASLVVPCLLDGLLQYRFGSRSNNRYRVLTGALAGIGLSMF